MMKTDEHAQLDIEEYDRDLVEAEMVDNVRHYWALTRQGPHDECLCHEMYVWDLKRAIKRLRLFRRTGEWRWFAD